MQNTTADETIGQRIARARKAQGETMAAFAARCGLGPMHIGAIERGARRNITPETILRIASALGCSTDWLLTGEGRAPTSDEQGAA